MNKPNFTKKPFTLSKDFKVRISQIPPMDVAFKTMAISEYELLVATIYKLNELIGMTNSYTELIDEILKWVVGDGLEQTTKDVLVGWMNDGTLEVIINDALFNQKLDKDVFNDFVNNTYESFVDTTNREIQNIKNNITQLETDKADKTYVDGEVGRIDGELEDLETIKADKTYVDGEVGRIDGEVGRIDGELEDLETIKADKTYVGSVLEQIENNEKIKKATKFLYGDGVTSFAHRGLSEYAPENSVHAFDMAGLYGCYGVEMDIQKTVDDGFVISHDDNTISMTNTNMVISSSTKSAVTSLTITKGNKVDLYDASKMLSLEQALFFAKRYDMRVLAELKTTGLSLNQVQKLIDIIVDLDMVDNVAIMSFDLETIQKVRELNDEIIVGYVQLANSFSQTSLNIVKGLMPSFSSVSHRTTAETISNANLAKNNGVPITFWSINDFPVFQTLLNNKVRSITSDSIRGTKPRPTIRSYKVKKESGSFKVDRRFNTETANLVVSGTSVNMYYGVPYTYSGTDLSSFRRGVVNITESSDNPSSVYVLIARGGHPDHILLDAINRQTGQVANLNQIPDGSYYNITISAYDFVGK